MTQLKPPLKPDNEPVLRPAVILGVLIPILDAVAVFGLNISEEQKNAILVLGPLFLTVFLAMWARKNAWSPTSVIKMLEGFKDAYEAKKN